MKTGLAFPDYIDKDNSKRRHFQENGFPRVRTYFLPLVIVVLFGLLIFRITYLQLIRGGYYDSLSNSNRIRTSVIHAPRGIIFDRNNTPLVFNVPGFREVVHGKTRLLDSKEALSIIAKGGKGLEIDSLREYPYKDALAHVVGFIGQISRRELRSKDFAGYGINDLVGKTGIEEEYEKKLRGVNGKELVEVDALGRKIRTLGETDPIPGGNIHLTIDLKLQETLFAAMKGVKKGAAIVSTPQGGILALVSKPSFDPNLFTMGTGYKTSDSAYKTVSSILSDYKNEPLLDRAVSGEYPPGSTFKIVVAATGLQDKIIDRNFQIEDTGILRVGAFSFANWYYSDYGKTDGMVNIVKAIKRSNDIFFYKLAEKVGVDRLSQGALKFGLGKRLGIDLPGEAKGLIPTTSWKEKVTGEPWYLGDTYHYGIGQGYLLTTPLQVNAWTQVIANGGTLYRPHLLLNHKPAVIDHEFLDAGTVGLIRKGMIEGCSPGGVGWPLFGFAVKNSKLKIDGKNILSDPLSTDSARFKDYKRISIACKTGTAQHGGAKTLPDAWITLFAPAYNPQIVVTILSEDSGEGSNVAGPIAKKVLQDWFSR
ncbi:penicillin-binding transpeptidase domain-containing protein [Patescibacteria group bacterium]|nr:penicillin-binding transpeptidase domain-containing protein [Patescibacteria group bacterium]MCL5010419.1 penicillin-binding transpeptidase domain-containing protein [Patescibacteria group bacterium]